MLEHLASLDIEGVSVEPWACVSPEDTDPADVVEGVEYIAAPNSPLSGKVNAIAEALQGSGIDALMLVDSDALVSPGYIAAAVRALQRGAAFVHAREVGFVDLTTGEAFTARTVRPGPGRTLSAEALDRLGWQPLEAGQEQGLNRSMDRRLNATGVAPQSVIHPAEGAKIVELKGSGVDMWTTDFYQQWKTADVDASVLLDGFDISSLLAVA